MLRINNIGCFAISWHGGQPICFCYPVGFTLFISWIWLDPFNQNHGRVRLYVHISAQSWQRLSALLLRWVRIARLAHGGAARSWAAVDATSCEFTCSLLEIHVQNTYFTITSAKTIFIMGPLPSWKLLTFVAQCSSNDTMTGIKAIDVTNISEIINITNIHGHRVPNSENARQKSARENGNFEN